MAVRLASNTLRVGINGAPLLPPRSGVGRYVASLLGALRARREGIAFRCLFGPGRRNEGPGALARLKPLIEASVPGAFQLSQAARSLFLGGVDVYHETWGVPPRFSGPVVVTVHDLAALVHPDLLNPAEAELFAREMPKRLPHASRLIASTHALKGELTDVLRLDPGRIAVVPHGVHRRFRPAPPGRTAAPPPSLDSLGVKGPYILYVGNLEARKNIAGLLRAYRALPAGLLRAVPLVLVGDQARIDAPARRLIEEGVSPGRVVVAGYLPDAELPDAYRAALVVAHAAVYEGFGLPVLEAMASGVPVVASRIPACEEVAGDAAILVAPEDADALASALARACEDTSLREDMKARGIARAAGFTWAKSAEGHVAAYLAAAAEFP